MHLQEVPLDSPEARRTVAGHTTIADLTRRISPNSAPDQTALAAASGVPLSPLGKLEAAGHGSRGERLPASLRGPGECASQGMVRVCRQHERLWAVFHCSLSLSLMGPGQDIHIRMHGQLQPGEETAMHADLYGSML